MGLAMRWEGLRGTPWAVKGKHWGLKAFWEGARGMPRGVRVTQLGLGSCWAWGQAQGEGQRQGQGEGQGEGEDVQGVVGEAHLEGGKQGGKGEVGKRGEAHQLPALGAPPGWRVPSATMTC